MSTALKKFEAALRDREVSEQTRQAYLSDAGQFLKANILNDLDSDTAPGLASKWIKELEGKVAEGTLRRRTVAVRDFCRTIYEVEVLAADPEATKAKLKAAQEFVDPWSRIGLPTLKWRGPTDNWQATGACKNSGLDFFTNKREAVAEAKACCATCPIQQTCLDFALTNEIDHGVWGGADENDRKAMRGAYVRVRN